jgi:hypothetical protein
MGLKWKLDLVRLEIVQILMQDRCLVCPEIPHAQKSFWPHPMELLCEVGHVLSHFNLFGDSASISAR